ncbi:MAG TPA: family 43 glycosylhydrolase [Sediminibacterium sp.]
MHTYYTRFLLMAALFTSAAAVAQNPFITSQFTADPSARVFGGRVYVYPSHDIPCTPGKGRPGWFCMEDYHVFSSDNLTDWTDHGVIVSQDKVPWVNPKGYSMWAPDCIYRNGKYYFYFPTNPKDTTYGRGFTIGVAIADKPEGPYIPQPEPIKKVRGIDPNVFIDKDGQAYLYWSQGNIYVAKLKENMLELDSEVETIPNLPEKGLKEGPYMFEHNGNYYLTFPHVENKTERLEYAMGKSPMGPFTMTGVIMDESPTGCWTNHHSILPFKGQWYLFYHHNDLSPQFDKNRSIRIDSLTFNADGTIRKVVPTLRGVGLSNPYKPIQTDRYSRISSTGVAIDFLDTLNRFAGWKTIFSSTDAWLQYNSVDFENRKASSVEVRAASTTGGTPQVRTGKADGPVIAEIPVAARAGWNMYQAPVKKPRKNINHLFISWKGEGNAEVDWIRFIAK